MPNKIPQDPVVYATRVYVKNSHRWWVEFRRQPTSPPFSIKSHSPPTEQDRYVMLLDRRWALKWLPPRPARRGESPFLHSGA